MFSWICPKCGTEVPPSYSDCPNCARVAAGPAAVAAPPSPPPARVQPPPPPPRPVAQRPIPVAHAVAPPPRVQAPPAQPIWANVAPEPAPWEAEPGRPPKPAGVLFGGGSEVPPPQGPPMPVAAPPPAYMPPPPAPSAGMPSWLLMILVAAVVGAIVAGAVWFKQRSSGTAETAAESTPASAASVPNGTHRLAKFLELTGFRLSEDAKQRANVRMVVVNHSAADLADLTMNVTFKTPQGKIVGTAEVKVPNVAPLGSTDVSAPLKTTERAYELPDWQFVRAEFEITSP